MVKLENNPNFDNGITKWYLDEELTDFASSKQNRNLPPLQKVMCFAVIGENISEYVLVNSKQQVLLTSHYGVSHSQETMETRIIAYKIQKNYEK